MNEFQKMVHDFNVVLDVPKSIELRVELIREEVEETIKAIKAQDAVATIDGLCDVLYVTYGAADTFNHELETQIPPPMAFAQRWDNIYGSLPSFYRLSKKATKLIEENSWPYAAMALESLANKCWSLGSDGLGVDLRPFFKEVHRTNMLKTSGPIREDGKRMKPPGWKPPRLAEMYAALEQENRKETA